MRSSSNVCAGMTCHARRESLVQKLQRFLNFKYIQAYLSQAKQITNLLLLSKFLSSDEFYRTDGLKKKATNCCIRSLVTRYGPQSVASASG